MFDNSGYRVGDIISIKYISLRYATNLIDVKIKIVDEKGIVIIDDEIMSEISSSNLPGIYYYEWTPQLEGNYVIYCNCVSKPRHQYETLNIGRANSLVDGLN